MTMDWNKVIESLAHQSEEAGKVSLTRLTESVKMTDIIASEICARIAVALKAGLE
jgi:hypothetical protein